MKPRTLILVVLIMAVLIIAVSCATDPMRYISKDYEIYGTWVNPDYNLKETAGRVVFYPNGNFEGYNTDTSTQVGFQVRFVITNKWTDSEGNIWYTIRVVGFPITNYTLAKISNSGRTLEIVDYFDDYPKEIDPSSNFGEYLVFDRQ